MGATKNKCFTAQQKKVANLAQALAHPARIAILEHLGKLNTCICGEIVDEIGLAQATISQHLKVLKEAGFIKGQTGGTKTCYCINQKRIFKLNNLVSDFLKSVTSCKRKRK